MKGFLGASLSIALAASMVLPAAAASLPEVKASANNPVPACATPGRLTAYLRMRNPRMDSRFDGVATQYMRHGEELGIRWDMAFFQMILETGALSYTGDVRADQNNFAGLGAAGGGKRGERFADIPSGVKAHLQHLLMYAGEHISDPVADRTRKVQEWGVLTDWRKSIDGPMTFSLVAQQWAPGSRGYVRDIAAISDGFYDAVCNQPDPRPELVQEARKGRAVKPETQVAATTPETNANAQPAAEAATAANVSGAQIAQRNIESARSEDPPRTSLGATTLAKSAATAKEAAKENAQAQAAAPPASSNTPPAVTLLNPAKTEPVKSAPAEAETAKVATAEKAPNPPVKTEFAKAGMIVGGAAKADTKKAEPTKGATIQTASVAGAATQMKVPETSTSATTCKVWTASYGGQRAILIKAAANGSVNYTVLDVNASTEKREVDAYIAAYAKGGEKVGAFPSQTQALDKAFQLCPEG